MPLDSARAQEKIIVVGLLAASSSTMTRGMLKCNLRRVSATVIALQLR